MALSDLQVYSEYLYLATTEILRQQVELFDGASDGMIQLGVGVHQGDFSQEAFYGRITGGTVRRRNAYGSGGIPSRNVSMKEDVTVKVASGTYELQFEPSNFRWILANPEQAAAVHSVQMARETLADYLNTALGATYAALSQVSDVVLDVSADGAANNADKASFINLNRAQALFGDRSSQIAGYIMHSTPMHQLYGQNLANVERLFTYGTVNVVRDPFGKLLLMTDSPSLFTDNAGTIDYHVLGLVPGAVTVLENDDFDAMEEGRTGNENLVRTYQAEWSFQLGIKGFAWDKANGGKSPNDAALLVGTNWDQIYDDKKDLAGVILNTRA